MQQLTHILKKLKAKILQNQQQRFYIWTRLKKGLEAPAIFQELKLVCGEETLSYTTVRIWIKYFKNGGTSVEDDEQPGRPITRILSDIPQEEYNKTFNTWIERMNLYIKMERTISKI